MSLGITLVGEDMPGTQVDLAEAGPGAVIAVQQDLFHEGAEAFERADRAGWLHGTATLTSGDRLVCQLIFALDGDPADTIVAVGVLPREGDSYGGGILAITGGTGQFVGADGAVQVETRNPKRYTL